MTLPQNIYADGQATAHPLTIADALLAECSRRGLEGMVAKRKDAPYRCGSRSGRVKVKTDRWKLENRSRGERFRPGVLKIA